VVVDNFDLGNKNYIHNTKCILSILETFDQQPNAGSEGGRDKFFLKRNVNVKWNIPRLVEHE
jgi:hypothetical protein